MDKDRSRFMGKLSKKAIVLVCCSALILSITGCKGTEPSSNITERHFADDSKPEGRRETSSTNATDPTSDPTVSHVNTGNYIPTSDTLTYPDHVALYEEIHPAHQRGNIRGKEAVSLLSEVEYSLIHHEITSYAQVEIYFENPENYGFDIKEPTWGEDLSVGGYDEEKAFYQSQLDLLLTIDGDSLTGDDKVCYEKMIYNCEESIYIYSYTAFNYYSMVFNYLVGPQSEILFVLDVYSFDTVEDAENYILLVKDIDRYFDSLCEFEETRVELGFASSDNSYEKAAESFDNLVAQKDDCFLYDSFEERLDNIRGLSLSEKNRLISENEKAMKEVMFPEFEECAERMRALKGSGGTDAGISAYRGGDAYFAALTRTSTNSNATVTESIDVLDQTIQDVYDEFMGTASSGLDWYSEYMHHTYSKGDIIDNLDFLNEAVKSDFPGIPAHEYSLMDVPEVFEENFSPAAYLGYHIDSYNSNVLIVNNSQVDENYGISIAHEGYPGHMYQSVYTRSHTKHLYLYLFESIGYSEGWATYAEYYSMKYFSDDGLPTKAMILKRDEWILGILASTRAEYGIHVENWTMQDCLDYFNGMGFEVKEEDFSQFFTLIVTDPGYYAKYGMGYLWTQKTMDEMRAKYPNATEKQLHTAYLDSLAGTFDMISEHMDAELG